MNLKKYHKTLGFVMLLPFVAWVITGVFFFVKPGYSQAYEKLTIITYPSITPFLPSSDNKWSEIKIIRSILGEHLLVKHPNNKWSHLNKDTMEIIESPQSDQVELLINDAIKHNSERYGVVNQVDNLIASTSTQVKITLNWNQMSLHQKGADTEFIQMMYKIHYLQWTGNKTVDNLLGVIGLVLVVILAFLGIALSFKSTSPSDKTRHN